MFTDARGILQYTPAEQAAMTAQRARFDAIQRQHAVEVYAGIGLGLGASSYAGYALWGVGGAIFAPLVVGAAGYYVLTHIGFTG